MPGHSKIPMRKAISTQPMPAEPGPPAEEMYPAAMSVSAKDGIVMNTLVIALTIVSYTPPMYPAETPRIAPTEQASSADRVPTASDPRAPATSWERTS